MKNILLELCQKNNAQRLIALAGVLEKNNIRFRNMESMALVVPSKSRNPVAVCAHFDTVPGSYGYNDNGMALLAALQLLEKRPADMEIVFTNFEERGFLGAQYYLSHTVCTPRFVINLDVCGMGDAIYCDPMNSDIIPAGCKTGRMPPSDANAFARAGIPSLCLSTAPGNMSFADGIRAICSTIHGNTFDNNVDILNFDLPEMVSEKVIFLTKSV